MPFSLRAAAVASVVGTLLSFQSARTTSASRTRTSADSVTLTGTWRGRANSAGFNGEFTMTMELEQIGDSVHGTYRLDYRARNVTPPDDITGHIKGDRVLLEDHRDQFWFDARFDRTHLNGRLARDRARGAKLRQ